MKLSDRLAAYATLLTVLLAPPAWSAEAWERIYGGTGQDLGYSVRQTTDGGYVVAGITTSFNAGGYWEIYLVKTNAAGDTLWTRAYSDPAGVMSFGDFVEGQQTTDGGYIVAGTMYGYPLGYQIWLIKTDALGHTLWARKYGGTGNEGGYSVQQTADGGYIVAGYSDTGSPGTRHVYLVKTDALGGTLWTRTIGGSSNDYGYSVRQTADGGYIVTGLTQSFGNQLQVYLIRTDASGEPVWQRNYGGPAQDNGYSVQQTSDGGYVVAGVTYTPSTSYQAWLIKTDASGDTLWTGRYGRTGTEYAQSVQQTSDGGYIVAGLTNSWTGAFQVYLVKTDDHGGLLWESTHDYPGYVYDFGMSVQQTSDRGYIVAGYTDNYGSGDQVYLLKIDPDPSGLGQEPSGDGRHLRARVNAAPNPFVSFARVPGHEREQFHLYDVLGSWVGMDRGDAIGAGLPPGVYFLKPEGLDSNPVRIVKVR